MPTSPSCSRRHTPVRYVTLTILTSPSHNCQTLLAARADTSRSSAGPLRHARFPPPICATRVRDSWTEWLRPPPLPAPPAYNATRHASELDHFTELMYKAKLHPYREELLELIHKWMDGEIPFSEPLHRVEVRGGYAAVTRRLHGGWTVVRRCWVVMLCYVMVTLWLHGGHTVVTRRSCGSSRWLRGEAPAASQVGTLMSCAYPHHSLAPDSPPTVDHLVPTTTSPSKTSETASSPARRSSSI